MVLRCGNGSERLMKADRYMGSFILLSLQQATRRRLQRNLEHS